MKSLFYRLIIFLNTASEKDTYYLIAWYMAHHFTKVANMGISQFAQECYVSPATVSRFCRALGYDNYAHLKQECQLFTSNERKFNNLINIPFKQMLNNPQEATVSYCKQVNQAISNIPLYLDWDKIDQLVNLIHDCHNVAFFGTQFSQTVSLHLQTDLLMLEKFTMVYLDIERQIECAKILDENSVAIILSVNGNFLNGSSKILSYLHKSKCKIVVITCRDDLDINPDITIQIGDKNHVRAGKHALLTVAELIALRYYAIFYPEAERQLEFK